jgi:hypothetical protein
MVDTVEAGVVRSYFRPAEAECCKETFGMVVGRKWILKLVTGCLVEAPRELNVERKSVTGQERCGQQYQRLQRRNVAGTIAGARRIGRYRDTEHASVKMPWVYDCTVHFHKPVPGQVLFTRWDTASDREADPREPALESRQP